MYRSVPNDNATAAIAVAFVRIEHSTTTTTTIALGGGGTRSSILDFVDVETTAFPTALGRRMSGRDRRRRRRRRRSGIAAVVRVERVKEGR